MDLIVMMNLCQFLQRNLAKGSSYTESSEAAQLEDVTSVLEANSKISHVMGEDSVVSDKCLRLEDSLLGKRKEHKPCLRR